MTGTKVAWRRWARDVEPAGPAEEAALLDGLVAWLRPGAAVLVYLPMPGEIDLRPLPARVEARYLVTHTPSDGPLTVHPLATPTERHPYGFEQPVAAAAHVPPDQIDIALVPGLAFDRAGGRLGRGLGYYDGLLARMRPDAARVGIVPSGRLVERLPTEAHDVPMTHLALPDGVRAAVR